MKPASTGIRAAWQRPYRWKHGYVRQVLPKGVEVLPGSGHTGEWA